MAKKNNYNDVSPQTQDEALKAAKATQRPGQTKEQTKLIAQGIEKGINHYKKKQKGRARELNKKIHKVSQQQLVLSDIKVNDEINVDRDKSLLILPWVLLFISWVGFAVYFFMDLYTS